MEVSKYVGFLLLAFFGHKKSKCKIAGRRMGVLREKNIKNHRVIADIYPIIQTAMNKFSEVDRVTLFRSHNGNGIPKAGRQSYTSCLQEVCTNKTSPIQQRWQGIPSDHLMMTVLTTTMRDGHGVLKITDEVEGILKNFCSGNNIVGVLSVPIHYAEDGFVFLNFCSTSVEDLTEIGGVLFEAHSVASRVKDLLVDVENRC